MDKEGVCCCCGGKYVEYGYSTWGLWTQEEEKLCWGEDKRACEKCNDRIISFARREKVYDLRAGKINTVMDDSFEILFETSSEDTTFKAIRSCILYKNGILRMSHIYENSNKDKTSFYRFKDNQYYVIDEIGKVLTEYQDLINSLPDFIENPYKTSSEKKTHSFGQKSNFRIWSF